VEQMGKKNKQSNPCGSQGGEQDGPGGDILGFFHQGMKVRRGGIRQKLKSGVQNFGGPDRYHGPKASVSRL